MIVRTGQIQAIRLQGEIHGKGNDMRTNKHNRMRYSTPVVLILLCGGLLHAAEGADPIVELARAIIMSDQAMAEEISQKLVHMGDSALPLLKEGLAQDNRPLQSRILKILNQIATAKSAEVILQFAASSRDKYMVRAAMEALRYPERDIDAECDQKILEFLLGKVSEGETSFAPDAARILGKAKKVDPKVRTEACVVALKKELVDQSDPNKPSKWLPDTYGTEAQFKIRQYVYAVGDIGEGAIPVIEGHLTSCSVQRLREYLTICLGFAGHKGYGRALQMTLESSKDSEARALAAMALGRLRDKEAIGALKKALQDPYSVKYQTCVGPQEIFPVREAAIKALQSMGVDVQR